MNDKSFINTKKLTDSLLNDLNIQIHNKENELLELKIKSNTAKKLISISKNINHLKPLVNLLNPNSKYKIKECCICNAPILGKRKTKIYCSNACKVKAYKLRGNTNV